MLIRNFTHKLLTLIVCLHPFGLIWADSDKVKISTTLGDIVVELHTTEAPTSAANFKQYIDSGFYDGTIFHRVIDGFMVQGGGYTADYKKKNTEKPIQNEANNGLKNNKYTLAMARTSAPHSATSQFFINTVDNDFLNHTSMDMRGWGYTVFARVIEGHNVVDQIGEIRTTSGGPFPKDVPADTIIINSISYVDEDSNEEQSASAATQ